jgi:hypothetical protein
MEMRCMGTKKTKQNQNLRWWTKKMFWGHYGVVK